ncbi:MAG: sugar transferase, partial [Candidatus Portnoybacteria bacterium]|nr:sugar transferase [Candidatus Portnoybacteria bacterium]
IVLAAWIFAIIFVYLGRFFVGKIQKILMSRWDIGAHRTLIIGSDGVAEDMIEEIKAEPTLGYRLVENLPDINMEEVRRLQKQNRLDDIILANPDFPREKVLELIGFCEEKYLNFKFVPNLFQTLTTNVEYDTLAAAPLIELKRTALDGWGRILKRVIDIVGGVFGLIIFLPVMAIIAILVKFDSKGPIIYKNERVGPKGSFTTYKFRSFKIECCTGREYDKDGQASRLEDDLAAKQSGRQGPVFKVLNDPRRTRVGRILEKTSLDELPQFYNVLLGNMSLVGPRPHMPKEVAKYEKWHKKVFNIKPGVTGLAQISGRSDIDFDEEAKLDIYYLENWSFMLDFKILFKTPLVVLFGKHK